MAADLSLLPHTGIVNQLCGDAHVATWVHMLLPMDASSSTLMI